MGKKVAALTNSAHIKPLHWGFAGNEIGALEMQKTKFNKRVGKQTPVVRAVVSSRNLQYFLMYDPRPCGKGDLLVQYPFVFFVPSFTAVKDIGWDAMRNWLISKTVN